MNYTFEITTINRKLLTQILENYSLEQLNKIPAGFNNNIIWNIGHIIVVQQMLVYGLSGLPMAVFTDLIEKYKKGTKPESGVSQEEVDQIKVLLFELIVQTKADYENGLFTNYSPLKTSMGFVLTNIEEALEYNNYHEGTHLGVIMSLRKFV